MGDLQACGYCLADAALMTVDICKPQVTCVVSIVLLHVFFAFSLVVSLLYSLTLSVLN